MGNKQSIPNQVILDLQSYKIIQSDRSEILNVKKTFADYLIRLEDETVTASCSSDEEIDDGESTLTPEQRFRTLQNIVNSIEKYEEAAKQLQGKDVIIMIGTTGSGKSTTINFLSKKKMIQGQQTSYSEEYKKQLEQECIMVDPNEKEVTKIGHEYRSETATLHLCPVKDDEGNVFYLLDAPGFEDTEGQLIDIANSFGIMKALKSARSVKIFLLASSEQFAKTSKADSIKKLIKLCSKLFENIQKCKRSTLLGFTFMKGWNIEKMQGKINGVINSLSDEKDLQIIRNFIQQKSEDDKNYAIINPLNSEEVENVLGKLKKLQSIPQNQIRECFKYTMLTETQERLEKLLIQTLSDLEYFIDLQEYEKIGKILKIFKYIKEQLNIKSLDEAYSKLFNKIISKNETMHIVKLIEQFPKDKQFDFNLFQAKFIKSMKFISWLDKLRLFHSKQLRQILSFDDIQNSFLKSLRQIYDNSIHENNYQTVKINLQKLKEVFQNPNLEDCILSFRQDLCEYYKEQAQLDGMYITNVFEENLYDKLIQEVTKKYIEQVQGILDFKSNAYRNFNQIVEIFQQLKICYEINLSVNINYDCEEIYKFIVKNCYDQVTHVKESLLNQDFTELYDQKKYNEFIQIYKILINTLNNQIFLKEHFQTYNVEQIIKDLSEKVTEKGILILKSENNVKTLKTKKSPFILLKNIRDVDPQVFSSTENFFLDFQLKISELAISYSEKIKIELKEINEIIQSCVIKEKSKEESFQSSIKRTSRLLSKPVNNNVNNKLSSIISHIKRLKKFIDQIDDLSWVNNPQARQLFKQVIERIEAMNHNLDELVDNQIINFKNYDAVNLVFSYFVELRIQNIFCLKESKDILASEEELIKSFQRKIKKINDEKCSEIYVNIEEVKYSVDILSEINLVSQQQLDLLKYLQNFQKLITSTIKVQFAKENSQLIDNLGSKVEKRINNCQESQENFKNMLLNWLKQNISYDIQEITESDFDNLDNVLNDTKQLQDFSYIIQICGIPFYNNLQQRLNEKLTKDIKHITQKLNQESISFEEMITNINYLNQNSRRFSMHLDKNTEKNFEEIKQIQTNLEKRKITSTQKLQLMIQNGEFNQLEGFVKKDLSCSSYQDEMNLQVNLKLKNLALEIDSFINKNNFLENYLVIQELILQFESGNEYLCKQKQNEQYSQYLQTVYLKIKDNFLFVEKQIVKDIESFQFILAGKTFKLLKDSLQNINIKINYKFQSENNIIERYKFTLQKFNHDIPSFFIILDEIIQSKQEFLSITDFVNELFQKLLEEAREIIQNDALQEISQLETTDDGLSNKQLKVIQKYLDEKHFKILEQICKELKKDPQQEINKILISIQSQYKETYVQLRNNDPKDFEKIKCQLNSEKEQLIKQIIIQKCNQLSQQVQELAASSQSKQVYEQIIQFTRVFQTQIPDLQKKFTQIKNGKQKEYDENLSLVIQKITDIDCSSNSYLQCTIQLIEETFLQDSMQMVVLNNETFIDFLVEFFKSLIENLKNEIGKLNCKKAMLQQKVILFINQQQAQYKNEKKNIIQILSLIIKQNPFTGCSNIQNLEQILVNFPRKELDIIERIVNPLSTEIQKDIDKHLKIKNYSEIKQQFKKIQEFQTAFKEGSVNTQLIESKLELIYEENNKIYYQKQKNKLIDEELNESITNILDIEKLFNEIGSQIPEKKNYGKLIQVDIEKQVNEMCNEIQDINLNNEQQINIFSDKLIEIRIFGYKLCSAYQLCIDKLFQIIQNNKNKIFSNLEFSYIFNNKLKNNDMGLLIIQENSNVFKNIQSQMLNKKTEKQRNLKHVLENTKGTKFDPENFEEVYLQYEKIFQREINKFTSGARQLESIDKEIMFSVTEFQDSFQKDYLQPKQSIIWTPEQKEEIIHIFAMVAVSWSIFDCQNKQEFRILHPVQVSTILRLLCINSLHSSTLLENNIVQVRTGEGKSIALGITSTILALLGLNVYCCCYSTILSERDHNDFKSFFDKFGVADKIIYSNFEKLSEKIINKEQDVRKLCLEYYEGVIKECNQQNNSNSKSKSVLIIDEIDFFFSEEFLGQTYNISIKYSNKEVKQLIQYVWKNRFNISSLDDLKSTEVYKNLFQSHQELNSKVKQIEEKFKQMIEDAKSMELHSYCTFVPQNSTQTIIAYKTRDSIQIGVSKGFKTAFAYIQEWQKKVIDTKTMEENLFIPISVCAFSYLEIPKFYDIILGVTGTYLDMSNHQKDMMKQYFQIKSHTIAPSIYDKSNFKFDKKNDIQLFQNIEEWHKEIYKQINNVIQEQRTVLVFFEDSYQIKQFQLMYPDLKVQILDEEQNEKNYVITKATKLGQTTLSTRSFGRGTDFICYNNILIENGGIHVIQTFLSEQNTEETQIQGRANRFSQPGSYSMVLIVSQVCSVLKFNKDQIPNDRQQYYSFFDEKRAKIQNSQSENISKQINQAQHFFQISEEIKQYLQNYQNINSEILQQKLEELGQFTDKKEISTGSYANYNPNAGTIKSIESDKLDQFNNPLGDEADLVVKGATNDKSLLIGLFYSGEGLENDINTLTLPALKEKGYKQVHVTKSELEFVKLTEDFDQLWIFSAPEFNNKNIEQEFVDAVKEHISKRKGLMIWAENDPFYCHANLILKNIPVGYDGQNPLFIQLKGNSAGGNILNRGLNNKKQEFGDHLITTGIRKLHEGSTICYPELVYNHNEKYIFGDLQVIGRSSDDKPCVMVLNADIQRGRIVIDCGFTKLMKQFWDSTAGTQRYVKNCYGWLYFLECQN